MPLKLLADENIDFRLIQHLRQFGYTVISVAEEMPGIKDSDVLAHASQLEALLITEDSDFGEWVFAHHHTQTGVLYLRYQANELEKMKQALVSVLEKHGSNLMSKFVVITIKKIRIREI